MWFYTALLTSVLSAFTVILSKRLLKGVSPSVLTWVTLVLATPIILVFAIKDGVPALNLLFFVGICGSVFFYTISHILGYKAIRSTDLSLIYPLVSLSPIFTLLVALFPPLSEKPTFIAILGVLVTLLGSYVLNASSLKEGLIKPIKILFENKASLLMIFSVLLDSIVIVFDKVAINNTLPKNTTFALFAENLLVIFGLLPILFFRNKHFLSQVFSNGKMLVVLGLLNAIFTILAFSAVGGGNVGIVATILKAQILFVLLFSFVFFKDKPKAETVFGSMIMIIGVILIKLGS
jgi:drug/metabolite transporter (DMT)-like permease